MTRGGGTARWLAVVFRCGAAAALFACALHGQTLPCYAYRLNDDVFAHCGGQQAIVLFHEEGAVDFAISGDRAALATRDGIRLVGPGGGDNVVVPGSELVYAACGTILAPGAPPHRVWDVLAGRPLNITPLDFPVCGPGRRVLAGLRPAPGQGLVVKIGSPVPLPNGLAAYGVSESGRYFAFTTDSSQICTLKLPSGQPVCYNMPVDGYGSPKLLLSVNDAGQVLYTGTIMQTCRYYGEGSQDVEPSKDHSNDLCRAVYVASPTLVPKVLVPYGTEAQWISEASVKGLLAARRNRAKRRDK